ncbi:MAG: flagellar motor switch protein FliM [Rhodothermales bacterium]|nr:flagellar motor switch protein FliM [Rhodothermales bacterium]MBO6780446.1 flagellar motor switch protein FliM [Rhodothermales bacterium]
MDISADEIAMIANAEAPRHRKRARAYNFRKPRLLSQDQLRLLNHVHSSFARDISVYLSAQLRSIVEMSLVTVEQVHYSEYVESTQAPSALYVMESEGQATRMILEYDPRLVLYTVEKLFGGHGSFQAEPREISQIEQRVMARVVERTYRGLEAAWEPIFPLHLSTSSFETDAEFVQVIPGTEPAVVASFEVGLGEHRAVLRICYPYIVIERMLGRAGIRQMLSRQTEPVDPDVKQAYEDTLRKTEVEVKAELGRTHLSIQDILDLSEGDVVALDRKISEPIHVVVGNIPQFRAMVGRAGTRKALRVLEVIENAKDDTDEQDESHE